MRNNRPDFSEALIKLRTSSMGLSRLEICICVLGVIALVIPMVRFVFRVVMRSAARIRDKGEQIPRRDRIMLRFQPFEFHPWMFAWCKTRADAMFDELPEFLAGFTNVKTILDLGCGYGIVGAFLLDWFEDAEIYAVEPSADRVRSAQKIFGPHGHVFQAAAPNFESSGFPAHFDVVFAVDMLHFLNDADLDLTLARIHKRLEPGDSLFIRVPMKPPGIGSMTWNIDRIRRIITGEFAQYRTVAQLTERIEKAGFEITRSQMSGNSPELHWFISTAGMKQKIERLVPEPVAAMGHELEENHS
jgi:SAM-dependent methyltransferase